MSAPPSTTVPPVPADPRALQRLRRALGERGDRLDDADAVARIARVALVSDFAIDTLERQPALLEVLLEDDGATPLPVPALTADNRDAWPRLLRRYRHAESTRLVWRDALGLDEVGDTLAGTTALAETCLKLALTALEAEHLARHGVVRDAHGVPQRIVVFALGKLGGGELNFSSDIDLVYAYPHEGESDGARPLAAETWFARLGQQLAKLLDEVTADGFCHRVDLRLRPHGNAGRVAWSFAAMEQYFQREGRDWERYAWQKARPVAGDIDAGERFLRAMRPFIYRRYLDFGALDGLRTMKASIAAEVARKELTDDIKRGPGGIREIEFLVQALQLIRGGRDGALRGRALLPMLATLVEQHLIAPDAGRALAAAYRFLRRVENRLQMRDDAQLHALPAEPAACERLARGLGYADWPAFRRELDAHRECVATEFEALLAPRERQLAPDALAAYWAGLPDAVQPEALAQAGFDDAEAADGYLREFARSPGVRGLSDGARARLDRVVPALLHAASRSERPMLALRRLLALLQNILRRSAYLALLDEQPAALTRLVGTVAESALLAERLASHPLLLDELLDVRIAGDLPDHEAMHAACAAIPGDDAEAVLHALNEVRQAVSFRIALAFRDGRADAGDCARRLAWLADAVVARVLALAEAEMARAHGTIAAARFAVIGYGSLGGEEVGFGSDLDLVFLYDAPPEAGSDGARALDAPRWFVRLAQKVVALLGTVTAAGRLYDVDVRLRPDGAKGLLVTTLASFREYQRERAWTWEHQALVRARGVAGDASLRDAFEAIRAEVLMRRREPETLRADVSSMRRRMRAELDRSQADAFDLKQGTGALVDLEFLLQALVLAHAADTPALCAPRATPALLDALGAAGVLDKAAVAALHAAHATLLARGLHCTLDRRPRRVPLDEDIERARASVGEAVRAAGLVFG